MTRLPGDAYTSGCCKQSVRRRRLPTIAQERLFGSVPVMRRLLPNPPTSWVWLLGLFTVASFVEGISLSHITVFIPLYLPELGVAVSDVARVTGMVVAISSAVGIPFVPFWGALADRYARQPIIIRSFLFHFLALIIMILAGDLWLFIVGRALLSFTMGNTGLMLTTVTERVPSARTGLSFTMIQGAIPMGISVGPLIGGPIVDSWGFGSLLTLDCILMGSVILGLSFGYRDRYVASVRHSIFVMTANSFLNIIRSPRLRILFPALFVLYAGEGLAFTYAPIAITSFYEGDNPGTTIGLVFGVAGLATLIVGPALGMAADRMGHWRVLIVILVAASLLWSVPALVNGLISFAVIWAAIISINTAGLSLVFSVMSNSVPSEIRGRVMAMSTLPLVVGLVIGTSFGSVVTQGSVFIVFPIAAVATALSVGMLFYASRQRTAPAVRLR